MKALPAGCLAALLAGCAAWANSARTEDAADAPREAEPGPALEEIVVVASGSVRGRQGGLGSVAVVDGEALKLLRPNHPSEALARVPGVWVARGSGQEHLMAIRSGVFAGPGACGEFLYLEHGVPIRPAGFCNINNLFELNTEGAAALEVVRGPASALYGGNALHGVVNAVPARGPQPWRLSAEAGPHGYGQARLGGTIGALRLDVHSTSTDGWRDDTGYGQQKLNMALTHQGDAWQGATFLAATLLNQETGGYVRGHRAYADRALRDSNPNPEAYRDAWSARLVSEWSLHRDGRRLVLTPYLRRSGMAFLQHFLPGKPLETNAQTSGGALARLAGTKGALAWEVGAQAEHMSGWLRQAQAGATVGSAFLVATRPPGQHYDYAVDSVMAAAFHDLRWTLSPSATLVHSLRVERLRYDYDNRALVGNTRDDGSACGFGGCLYTRPPSREDAFTNWAGRLGLHWRHGGGEFYATAGVGFRPPQATELYRLQSGQLVADIDSENLVSFELGWRGAVGRFDGEAALYSTRTEHLIFRDADGFNVSDGETRSEGLEFALGYALGAAQRLELTGAWARHRYAFDRAAARGERIQDGADVDSAPRWLGSGRWTARRGGFVSELEAVYVGSHFIDAANTARYGGHLVFHWRGRHALSERLTLFARLLNLTDERYADRADYAFGAYRYFPALPRQFYAGVEWTL